MIETLTNLLNELEKLRLTYRFRDYATYKYKRVKADIKYYKKLLNEELMSCE